MSPSIMICPATCELCQHVMPSHSTSCPRNGVHPSKWVLAYNEDYYSGINLQRNDDTVTREEESSSVFSPWSSSSFSLAENNMTVAYDDNC